MIWIWDSSIWSFQSYNHLIPFQMFAVLFLMFQNISCWNTFLICELSKRFDFSVCSEYRIFKTFSTFVTLLINSSRTVVVIIYRSVLWICRANQWNGFFLLRTSVMKDLIQDFSRERFLLFLGLRLSATTLLYHHIRSYLLFHIYKKIYHIL